MATITVRNLDQEVHRRLRRRAAKNNRSMEAEARAVLAAAVLDQDLAATWLDATADLRGEELPIPERSIPRTTALP